jgi:AcrR family transcriptional regulator
VPKLWNDTIEEHRRAVRDATLDAAAALISQHGFSSVTMSRIAAETGIGRATLYKYFPDVDAIVEAWHERQIAAHLEHLADVRDKAGNAGDRLSSVLEAYAFISHQHHSAEGSAHLHQGQHVAHARQHLRDFVAELLADGARVGVIRDDVSSDELADYCLHALSAASSLTSKAAVTRLVRVIETGLRANASA